MRLIARFAKHIVARDRISPFYIFSDQGMQRMCEIVDRTSPLTVPSRGVVAVHLSSVLFDSFSSLSDDAGHVFAEGRLRHSVSRFAVSQSSENTELWRR
jgi:hypothetical protein